MTEGGIPKKQGKKRKRKRKRKKELFPGGGSENSAMFVVHFPLRNVDVILV